MVKTPIFASVCIAAVFAAYANHFENSFHFDDSHAVVDNAYIRDLRNVPRFFTDTGTFSNLPANRGYRPLIPLSLAIDYRLGHGLKPLWFQASTFFWFVVQLLLMQALFRRICDIARPHPGNQWIAWFAAALYGLHPANAETVNYVIQRGDVYSTLGVVAGVAIYAFGPRWRRFGLYLFPVAAALLCKPPALIFPALLFVYVLLFEDARPLAALRKCVPALTVAGIFGFLVSAMTPASFVPTTGSAFAYRITQPLVALRYFRTFLVPDRLSADSDNAALTGIFDGYAWVGFLFVGAVVLAACWCSKRREWRPAAFGLWWFLLALLPTALFPLAEVENDHRMYFPFVGLALAACWPVALWLYRMKPLTRGARATLAAVCVVVLATAAVSVRERNVVWHSEESLWYDVTVKSPHNGRGLMNYGLTQMGKGEMQVALDYFERALVFAPNYPTLEANLGIANGALNRTAVAEQHFLRALQLAPAEATSHFFYARWLQQNGRSAEARLQLQIAVAVNPDHLPARYLLMECSASQADWAGVKAIAAATLQRFPSDPEAVKYLALAATSRAPSRAKSPEDYLNLSLTYYRAGKYPETISAARETLRLRPDCAEAYNNIAAAYQSMAQWKPAIAAAGQALKLKPDFPLARNNLLWSQVQLEKEGDDLRAAK